MGLQLRSDYVNLTFLLLIETDGLCKLEQQDVVGGALRKNFCVRACHRKGRRSGADDKVFRLIVSDDIDPTTALLACKSSLLRSRKVVVNGDDGDPDGRCV